MCEGVPRSFTSGPVLSKLRVSGFCDLRLRPRPRRFCCPCLIGSRSYRSTDLVSHRGEMHVSCDSYLVTRNSPPLGFSGSSQAGPRVFASIHNPRPDYPIQTRVPRAFGRQAKWPIVPAISQMRMRPGLISPDVANAVTGGILVLGLRRGVARSAASPGRMLQLLSARLRAIDAAWVLMEAKRFTLVSGQIARSLSEPSPPSTRGLSARDHFCRNVRLRKPSEVSQLNGRATTVHPDPYRLVKHSITYRAFIQQISSIRLRMSLHRDTTDMAAQVLPQPDFHFAPAFQS